MGQLKISFKFFTLFVHHVDGLSVLLPVGGHTAEIKGALIGQESLKGVTVDLDVKDGTKKTLTSRTGKATKGRLTDVTVLDPGAAASLQNVRAHLKGPLQSSITSRFNLTDGSLSDTYDFEKSDFAGAIWQIGGGPGTVLTDTIDYVLPLDPANEYTLKFSGALNLDVAIDPTGTHELLVSNGDTVVNAAGCPEEQYSDPFYLYEFRDLFAAVGVTVGVPETPMPAHLAQLHQALHDTYEKFKATAYAFNKTKSGIFSLEAFGAAAGHETICKPCPDGCIYLD